MFDEVMRELSAHQDRLTDLYARLGAMVTATSALKVRLMYARENAEREVLGVQKLDEQFLAETVNADG